MNVTRIFDLLSWQATNFKKADSLASKENNEWKTYSTLDFIENANSISFGLLESGIGRQDKVATISNNRPEWNFVDMGVLQAGAVHVPMYPNISEADYEFILNDAEVKIVFVSDENLYKIIHRIAPSVKSLKEIYTFNKIPGAKHWTELKSLGQKNADPQKLAAIKDSIVDTDLATLIYTSGTTGTPKGVMLSHKNLVSNFVACKDLAPVDHRHRALSFLPLNHVYERMLTYLYMYLGVSIYYAESREKIADNLKEIKPHVFSTVPMLLEKVYDKIVAKGNELTGIKKNIVFLGPCPRPPL